MTTIVRLTIPFIIGMVLANFFVGRIEMEWMLGGNAILVVLMLLTFLFRRKRNATSSDNKDKDKSIGIVFGILAMAFSCSMGMSLYAHKYLRIAESVPTDTAFCYGTLCELPKEKPRSYALKLKQENGTYVLLYLGKNRENKVPQVGLGDTVYARITHLNRTNDAKGVFADYNKYLFHNGVCATAYASYRNWNYKRKSEGDGWSFEGKVREIQQELHSTYKSHGFDGDSGELIEAMTLGRKSELSKDMRQKYSDAGVSHILALSGYHVGIILVVLQTILLTKITPYRWKWISNVAMIAILWLYAIIAGLSPSLVRATIMCTVISLCQSTHTEIISLNSIAITAISMLIYNPMYLHDVGFQLSFVSIIGIALFYPIVYRKRITRVFLLNATYQTAVLTCICSIVTAPLIAYYFGSIPLYSILSNLAITVLVFVIMWSSLLWWTTLWIPFINNIIAYATTWSAAKMNEIVTAIASLPHSTIEWHPSTFGVIASYMIIALIAYEVSIVTKRRA